MTTRAPDATAPADVGHPDFSVVLGGPLYQVYLRFGILRPPVDLVHRRVIAAVAITWLPLLVLTMISGVALANRKVPFLYDLEVHGRFLIGLPLLIAGEVVVHGRLREAVRQFEARRLIAREHQARFQAAIDSSLRLRNSAAIEVLLLAFTVLLQIAWRDRFSLTSGAWWAADVNGEPRLGVPGYWLVFVSLPIFRFIVLRWCFRVFLWHRFLWKVSRIPLRLNALHSDRVAGLGFLGATGLAFAPVMVAFTAAMSMVICNEIWHDGAWLPQFKFEILAIVLGCIAVAFLPQAFFSPQLVAAQRTGRLTYGPLVSSYVDEFQSKWMAGTKPAGEALIGSADIQSLADLSNSYEVLNTTRSLPFGWNDLLRLAVIVALPFAPLMLTMIPLNEIINRILKLVF